MKRKRPILHAAEPDLKIEKPMDKMRGIRKKIRNMVSGLVVLPKIKGLERVDGKKVCRGCASNGMTTEGEVQRNFSAFLKED
jgi:hypothetical protein